MPKNTGGKVADARNYQVYVSDRAWGAFPKWGRSRFLAQIPLDIIIPQPLARRRTRRCCRLTLETAAKLEVIAINNQLRNPWSPNALNGTRIGSGRIGLAIEAIGQRLYEKG